MTLTMLALVVLLVVLVAGGMPAVSVLELKATRKEKVLRMEALAEKGTLTAEEEKEFAALTADTKNLKAQIDRSEHVASEKADLARTEPVSSRPPVDDKKAKGRVVIPAGDIENVAELVYLSRFQPHDSRVQALMQFSTGESGGIPIPDEFVPTILSVTPAMAVMESIADVIPAGGAPDAEITMPALNQKAGSNMYGGVDVTWTETESQNPPADKDAKLREVSWKPKEVTANTTLTNKLIRNWPGALGFVTNLFRLALAAKKDYAFLRENGIGKPRGVLQSGCLLKVNRALANKVGFIDLVNMEAKILEDVAEAVFIVSPSVIPQLRVMEDTAGHLIWNENARDGGTPTLLGRKVMKSFRSPALGSLGDVLLVTGPHYKIRPGAGLAISTSEHVLFKENKTVVKLIASVDGGFWLDGPIVNEDAQSYSPAVALDVPA